MAINFDQEGWDGKAAPCMGKAAYQVWFIRFIGTSQTAISPLGWLLVIHLTVVGLYMALAYMPAMVYPQEPCVLNLSISKG